MRQEVERKKKKKKKKKRRTNLPSSLDLSKLNKSITGPVQSFANRVGSLCFSFSPDDGCLSFLFGLLNHKFSTFSILLCDLFLFNCGSEFFTESGLLALSRRRRGGSYVMCVCVVSLVLEQDERAHD